VTQDGGKGSEPLVTVGWDSPGMSMQRCKQSYRSGPSQFLVMGDNAAGEGGIQQGPAYHFVGIGGCGMSAVALMLAQRGYRVTGSDMRDSAAVERLSGAGISVAIGHGSANLPGRLDCLVVSAAIKQNNPEWQWAAEHGVQVCKYAELLGELSRQVRTLAVAGTHGKSTTSGWLAYVLKQARLDPSFVIGAEVDQLGGPSGVGQGQLLVVEACEYDRSFLNLRPAAAAVLNIEADHLDYYSDLDEIVAAFGKFAALIGPNGLMVANVEDANVAGIAQRHQGRCEQFAVDPNGSQPDWQAERLRYERGCGCFELVYRQRCLGPVTLLLAGRHNVSNALAVAALAHEAGVAEALICQGLSSFAGAARRMSYKGRAGEALVLDDYAHHPTEINVTLEAIRAKYQPQRLWCVFQPHQHSRTRCLLDEFALSFRCADVVLLPDIYFVRDSEALRREINAEQLAERIRQNGCEAHYVGNFTRIVDRLSHELGAGDVVVTMGAGDIWKLGDELICRFGRDRQV